jgi:copper chaperone CopZ
MLTTLLLLALGAENVTHRITGLFSPEREVDLREAAKQMEGVDVVSVDVARGEAVFAYDPAKLFKGVKEKDYVQRFDQLLRQASRHTFGARPRGDTPWEKLVRVEIPVTVLDCRGCELSAYEAVAKIDGVEQATAVSKDGKVVAMIDPAKTGRDALVDALKKRQVLIK